MYNNVLVISDNAFLSREFFNIIKEKDFSKANFVLAISPYSQSSEFTNAQILDQKKSADINQIIANYDLVLSLHCKQIFPPKLVNTVKCINIHPGYNPINRGWYPQVFSILNDLPIGATIHEIDIELDHGPIIARAFVNKESHDTSESLYDKIVHQELALIKMHIEAIIHNNYITYSPEDDGNLFLKKDFNELLELDLNEQASMGTLIRRLRALSHGNFNNAYYIDADTGKKVFVSIKLNPEENE